MRTGARQAAPTALRRLAAAAVARHLRALVVPGPEALRARQLDLERLGIRVAAGPRQADVLVVVGALPPQLRAAATVAYAQMPRPRAILAIAAGPLEPLPAADVAAGATQPELAEAVAELRLHIANAAFAGHVEDFDAPALHGGGDGRGPGVEPEHRHGHGHDHGHGAMDFMSMVAMTEGLPRGRDGLPMERIEVPFGPLFPGLPGGLTLTLTLAGDGVAGARVGNATAPRALVPGARTPVAEFVERLTDLDPLTPVSYRLLACRAVEDAARASVPEAEARARRIALERERAASHLSWLCRLGRQLGLGWLERRAARLELAVLAGDERPDGLAAQADALARRLCRTPLARARLAGLGEATFAHFGGKLTGPAARAAGRARDLRARDPLYAETGFEPAHRNTGDAFARLEVRLDEIRASLALASDGGPTPAPTLLREAWNASGEGRASLETPRGEAVLHVSLDEGYVTAARLEAPSTRHLQLLPELLVELELGDALLAANSFDPSPWEAGAA